MPQQTQALKRYLLRAGGAYLAGALVACGWMLLTERSSEDFSAAGCLVLSLMAGLVTGGWYIGGYWIRKQVTDGIIAPTLENAMNTLLFAALVLISPLLFIPAILAGLLRLHRLTS